MDKPPFNFFEKHGYRRPRSVEDAEFCVTDSLIWLREREAEFNIERENVKPTEESFIALDAVASRVQLARVHHRLLVRELKRLQAKKR